MSKGNSVEEGQFAVRQESRVTRSHPRENNDEDCIRNSKFIISVSTTINRSDSDQIDVYLSSYDSAYQKSSFTISSRNSISHDANRF